MTRVLGGDEIRFGQRLMCPRTQIAQVANRRRDNLQTTRRFNQRILPFIATIRLLAIGMLPL